MYWGGGSENGTLVMNETILFSSLMVFAKFAKIYGGTPPTPIHLESWIRHCSCLSVLF